VFSNRYAGNDQVVEHRSGGYDTLDFTSLDGPKAAARVEEYPVNKPVQVNPHSYLTLSGSQGKHYIEQIVGTSSAPAAPTGLNVEKLSLRDNNAD
jgi:hypothetical protein